MSGYDTVRATYYSPFVVHFTRNVRFARADLIDAKHPLFHHKDDIALDRLLSILKSKIIHATPMPWLPRSASAVCFTECVWDALKRHTIRYSQYGVVFSKRLIQTNGGGPELYVRGDVLKALGTELPPKLEPFVAPFDPDAVLKPGVPLDWLTEREWRLPSSLSFEYHNIEHVIVATIDDAVNVVRQIGERSLPMEKLIPMEVYETIRKSWSGQHNG